MTGIRDTITPNLKRMIQTVAIIERAAVSAGGAALLNDALTQSPTPPLDTGNLRGSWSLTVEGTVLSAGPDAGSPDPGRPGRASVAFNTPYAAYQHEGISKSGSQLKPGPKSQAAGAGPKFLEKKMVHNKNKYGLIMTDAARKKLGELIK